MADTYQTLLDRISRDFRRGDLATDIPRAVLEAIRHFQNEPFYSADATYGPIATVVGQKEYDLPSDFSLPIDGGWTITANGVTYPLVLISVQEIDALDSDPVNPIDGVPLNIALHGSQFKIWPVADSTDYEINVRYLAKQAPPDLPTSSSTFWTNDGQDLIYHYARGLVELHKLKQREWAQASFAQAQAELTRLREVSDARTYAAGRFACVG